MSSLRNNITYYQPPSWTEIIALISILGAVVFVIALAGRPPNPPPFPRLVGYECEGASGPLYAEEEDHFPKCAKIERY